MKVQTKLNLGLGFLTFLILLLASVSLFYVRNLAEASDSILHANYNSLEYVRKMYDAMDQGANMRIDSVRFANNLNLQLQNITEIGEREMSERVAQDFELCMRQEQSELSRAQLRHDLFLILTLNMQALERKSIVARKSGELAMNLITVTATLCSILALVLLVNLPSTISKPLRELLNGIRQISAKNYQSRLHMNRRDEFRDLGDSFNLLAVQLGEYYSSSMSRTLVEKKRMETLVNSMHDPVLILNEEKRIIFINDMACRILGVQRETVLQQSAVELSLQNDLLRSLLQSEHDASRTITQRSPLKIFSEGKESYFEIENRSIYSSPQNDAQSQYLGDVFVLRNVTAFKEYDVAKSSFIATVSHELKTPISAIKMSLQLLEKPETGTITHEQHQLIESMLDDCARLLKISSELLNMTQAETGNIKLNVQAASCHEIVHYALSAIKALAENRHIHCVEELDPLLPPILADAEKVTWVLINFLTNALRYSPEQSTVHIRVRKEATSVVFSVQDEGKGIEQRYRDRIFDRYFQVPGSSKSGSGLGLAISREFIEAQNGTIGVDSEIGYGSTFWFRLQSVSSAS